MKLKDACPHEIYQEQSLPCFRQYNNMEHLAEHILGASAFNTKETFLYKIVQVNYYEPKFRQGYTIDLSKTLTRHQFEIDGSLLQSMHSSMASCSCPQFDGET